MSLFRKNSLTRFIGQVFARRGHEANAGSSFSAHRSGPPRQTRKLGHQQHANQDGQHRLNQQPGFFSIDFGGKKFTPKVFSALKENSSASTGKKGVLVYTKKLVFKGKEGKMHMQQRTSKVFVGDPFARYWCADFGRL